MKEAERKKTEYTQKEFAKARLELSRPIPTGARVIVLRERIERQSELIESVSTSVDSEFRVARFSLDAKSSDLEESDAVVYEELGLAIIDHHDGAQQSAAIASLLANTTDVEDSIPEFYAFANHAIPTASAVFVDTNQFTWGLQAIGVPETKWTGKGIKVAVLDTGIDFNHPDFTNRVSASRSFVAGESVDDGNGHGTHCCGTVAGPVDAKPRYGVAPDVSLLVGKVLSNAGSGRQRDILSAMVWAVQQGANVISMSLGRATRPGEPFDPAYERAGNFALTNGCLVVAAAGNDSDRRFGFIAPVTAPANSPSILAVAALDQDLIEANFSCGGINPNGGEVEISGPGVAVFSSWPMPRKYRSIPGTSMACPHVAGAAALFAESDEALRGSALWQRLKDTAVDVGRNPRDVGAGLVQAP